MRGSAYWFREGGGAHRSPRRYDLGAQPADECCSKYSFRNKGTTAGLFTVMCGHGFIWVSTCLAGEHVRSSLTWRTMYYLC